MAEAFIAFLRTDDVNTLKDVTDLIGDCSQERIVRVFAVNATARRKRSAIWSEHDPLTFVIATSVSTVRKML